MAIKLIAGLRNPGSAYQDTRHNAGAWFVEEVAKSFNASFKLEKKLRGDLANIECDNIASKLFLPNTFMNESGMSLRAICDFYQITSQEVLICHDDLDLNPGRIKIKTAGGHGGHNGIKSIVSHLGSNNFHRLRIGIGHPGDKQFVLNYVLHKPTVHERTLIFDAINRAVCALSTIVSGNIALAMNQLNN